MNNLTLNIKQFFSKPIFSNYRTLLGLWVILSLIPGMMKISNNFLIFKYVFFHTINQAPLYDAYPELYGDLNHYGPLFSMIIAPFAVIPTHLGVMLWCLSMSLTLFYVIRLLPIDKRGHIFIYWFCAHELLTALFMSQFNILTTAGIIASFYCVKKEKDIWATLFILIGTFVKLYGIVGLAFFLFSRHKTKFILSFIAWSAVLFVAPMPISSPDYIIDQYQAWFTSLSDKNADNMFSIYQNVSLLGIIRKTSRLTTYSDLPIIVTGLILFALPYLRIKQYKNETFQYALLSSVLMFVVLFSTGSESSSYIIALIGVAIWYATAPWKRSRTDIALMVFAFIITSMSPSDLFPKVIRQTVIQPYALKALPCVFIWFKLCWEMMTRDYSACTAHGCHIKSLRDFFQ